MASGGEFDQVIEVAKVFGTPGAVAVLGWWLRSQFVNVSKDSKSILEAHEIQDERRHRQNLVRFARINMKLGIADHEADNGNDD